MKSSLRLFGAAAFTLSAVITLSGCQPNQVNSAQAAETKNAAARYQETANGVIVQPSSGEAKLVRVEVYRNNIFRVTNLPHDNLEAIAESIQVTAKPQGEFSISQQGEKVTLTTSGGYATVDVNSGNVAVFNNRNEQLLTEVDSGTFGPVTADPVTPEKDSFSLRQQWNKNTDEAFYGLGQHQNGEVNFAGDNLEMTTYNLEITIPLVVSSRNYGVLWDNASVTHFGNPEGAVPLPENLKLYDAQGKPGGLTAKYFDGDKLLLTRVEAEPDYQFLANNSTREHPFPDELGNVTAPRVEWSGSIESDTSGNHFFRMYNSGYAQLWLGGEKVLDRWRMNWNPWYHDVRYEMTAGKKTDIRINWDSEGGYIRLKHAPPLAHADQYSLSFASESGKAIDYYVVIAEDYDGVIQGYRALTGKAVMLPKWAYGFWQSRERYQNQQELVDVVKEYRKRKIPLDNIVLDWSYWPEDKWGSHEFDKEHFPDPKKMVEQIHDLDAQIMISVWPKFYPNTKNYQELAAKGYMLSKNVDNEKNLDWIGKGYLNGFYDPYPEESQQIFWRQIEENLNVLGIDAWWLDASEPDIHSNLSFTKRKEIMTPLSVGSGTEYFNSYALPNAEGVYKGERKDDPEKRSFILTRSGFGGIQRTGAAIWSGDTVPRWSNLREQIAAGISTGLSGMPNWTMDIGGFTPENKYRNTSNGFVGHFSGLEPEDIQPWQELNVRWFQFGAFVPLFRSHGQNPYREIYNIADEGSKAYDSMVYYTKLRYRLMPYIYSEAGKQYHQDDTLMRGLIMDFPEDKSVRDINNQYMFGPAFLVNPVDKEGATAREVYLPEGTKWYDFYTGKSFDGGQTVSADAPLERMPLFVRAGSIVPTGPAIQTVYEKPDAPILLTIYAGADGNYSFYEDDGKSYDYEKGEFSFTPIRYDDSNKRLVIGARQGQFPEQNKTRKFRVRLIRGEQQDAANLDVKPEHSISYKGEEVIVQL
ncbi:TIM-barrel domain-containing protein [Alteromonas pelagimontana]|uniref:TIM-barrel domain-containing protein n=1 Tax=Alteromonas pelagimontana TaxID=1858656 RepID=UPI001E53ED7E|nr:TIM-barrel domain-containing protein [Alteromonas pelagimontana]